MPFTPEEVLVTTWFAWFAGTSALASSRTPRSRSSLPSLLTSPRSGIDSEMMPKREDAL